MKKKILISLVFIMFLAQPLVSLAAVSFDNPGCDPNKAGQCFLIDLRNFGKNNTFADLLLYLVQLVLGLVAILAIAFIVYGGFQYITSRGDEEQAGAGKKTLTNAIIGLVIVILSYIIVAVIVNALNNRV